MDDKKRILIVEGQGDKVFFEKLFDKIGFNIGVKIHSPKDYNFDKDGKKRAITLLETLIKQLIDGSISHLGIVLDADFVSDHWGFEVTFEKIKKLLKKSEYGDPEIKFSGLAFPHLNGLGSIGLWIMPDNSSEGMLEDWIKQSVQDSEKSLLGHAIDTTKKLFNKKFKPIHNSKAEVATWMAWQKRPGCGFDQTIDDSLINLQSKNMIQLVNWIKYIYKVESSFNPEKIDNTVTCEEE